MLLENGYINSRGKSYASGTAYSEGNGGFFNGGSSGGGSSSNKNSSSNKSSSSKKSPSSSSKDEDDMDKIDWIEIAISRIENAIDKLKKTAESAYKSLKSRSTASVSEISKINEELALQQKAYDRYLQEANSVGLSEDLAEKVRNGTIDINEYNSETRDLISQFQNWYEKSISCSNAIDDLHESLAGLYEDNFKNIETDFENQLSLLEHLSNTYETNLDKLEAKGRFASQSYYTALNDIETKNIAVLNKELESLTNSFSEAMRSGEIEEQSESWYSMQSSINDVKEAIDEATLSILENEKAMRELDWSYFDYVQERIDTLTQESNFLIGLMESSNLYKDNGQFNDKGMATLGLRTQNYNVYMAQADKYAQEMLKVSKELANDPYNKDLIERREELLKLQQDAISSAEDEKQAIVDLVKDGIDIELDSLKELIDARKDSLSSAKDLYEFEKKTKEQTAEIAKLQKTISAYSGDLSSETKAKVQKLTVDLANAQQSLEESQYDKFISDNEALLDNLYDEYENILNERLDNVDLLISDMIDAVNTNSASISQTLEMESEKVGYTITDGMKSIWNNDGIAGSIVSKYGDNFTSQLTSVNQVLNAINAKVSEMVTDSDKQIKDTVTNTTPVTEPINPPPPPQETKPETEPVVESPPAQPTNEISVGSKINAGSAKIYTSPNGKALNQFFKSDPIYTVLEEKNGFLKVRYHKLTSGETGWFKKSDVKAYKTGGLVDYTGLAQLDGTKEKPELVLNATDTENFISLRDVLRNMAKNTLSINNARYSEFSSSMPSGIIDTSRMIAKLNTVDRISGNSVGDININIPIEHVENYNDFVNQLKQDSQFEQLIQSMTIDRLAGGSSLAKNKFNWK